VRILTPTLSGQVAYDGTDNHHQGRQAGFWAHTEQGWQRVKISAVIDALDDVLCSALATAYEDQTEISVSERERHSLIMRNDAIARAHLDRLKAGETRIKAMEQIQKVINAGGVTRGQFVAALRDSGELDLDEDAVLDMVRSYLRVAGREGRSRVVAVVAPPG
jgi:hypothetical protein